MMKYVNLISRFLLLLILSSCGGNENAVVVDDSTPVGGQLSPLDAQDDVASTLNASPVSIAILDNDSAQSASVTLNVQPTLGTATFADGVLDYRPAQGAMGIDTFTYTLTRDSERVSATVTVINVQTLELSGVVSEDVLRDATVSVSLNDETFSTSTSADGRFSLTLSSSNPDDVVVVLASGRGNQSNTQLVQLLGAYSDLISTREPTAKKTDNKPKNTSIDNVQVSFVSTAYYSLIIEQNNGSAEIDAAQLPALESALDSAPLYQVAAVLKVYAEQQIAELTAKVETLLTAIQSFEQIIDLINLIEGREDLNDIYEDAQQSVSEGAQTALSEWPAELFIRSPGQGAPINTQSRLGDYFVQTGSGRCHYYTLTFSLDGECSVNNNGQLIFTSDLNQADATVSTEVQPLTEKGLTKDAVPYVFPFFDTLDEQTWSAFTAPLTGNTILTNEVFESLIEKNTTLSHIVISQVDVGNQARGSATFRYAVDYKLYERLANAAEPDLKYTINTESESVFDVFISNPSAQSVIPFNSNMVAGTRWMLPLNGSAVPNYARNIFPSPGWSTVDIAFLENGIFTYSLENYFKASSIQGEWSITDGFLNLYIPDADYQQQIRLIDGFHGGYTALITASSVKASATFSLIKSFPPQQSFFDVGQLAGSSWLSSFSLTNPANYVLGRFSPFNSFGWLFFDDVGLNDDNMITGALKQWDSRNDAPQYQTMPMFSVPPVLQNGVYQDGLIYFGTHSYSPIQDSCWDNFVNASETTFCSDYLGNRARVWQPLQLENDRLWVLEFAQAGLNSVSRPYSEQTFDFVNFISPRLNYYESFRYNAPNRGEILTKSRDGVVFDNPYQQDGDLDRDGISNRNDNDADNDGVINSLDAFPTNPRESLDTDADGIGNNADQDDDNDSLLDVYEITFGLDPLNPDDKFEDRDLDGESNFIEYLNFLPPGEPAQPPLLSLEAENDPHGCSIGASGIRCFGSKFDDTSIAIPTLTGLATHLASSDSSYCAIVESNALCWGDEDALVNDVPSDLGPVRLLDVGFNLACAVHNDNDVACWGEGITGDAAPLNITPLSRRITRLSVDEFGVCVLDEASLVTCWGNLGDDYAEAYSEGFVPSGITNIFVGEYTCYTTETEIGCSVDGFNGRTQETLLGPFSLSDVKIARRPEYVCTKGTDRVICVDRRSYVTGNNTIYSIPIDLDVFDYDISRNGFGDQLCYMGSDEIVFCEPLEE